MFKWLKDFLGIGSSDSVQTTKAEPIKIAVPTPAKVSVGTVAATVDKKPANETPTKAKPAAKKAKAKTKS